MAEVEGRERRVGKNWQKLGQDQWRRAGRLGDTREEAEGEEMRSGEGLESISHYIINSWNMNFQSW